MLRKDYGFFLSENRMVRRKFVLERKRERDGSKRKLMVNSIIRIFIIRTSHQILYWVHLRKIKATRNVTCMGYKTNICRVLVVRPDGNHLEDLGVNGKILLKWTRLMQLRTGTSDGLL